MYIKRIFVFVFVFLTFLNADSNNTTPSGVPRFENTLEPKAIIEKDMVVANDDDNITTYNIADLNKFLSENNNSTVKLNKNIATSTQAIMGGTLQADTAYTSNPNKVTTPTLQNDNNFATDESVQNGFDDETKNSLLIKSMNNQYVKLLDIPDTINCYIARDISFRWECPTTNIVYGGDINSNGRSARLKCEEECYQQYSCQAIHSNLEDEMQTEKNFTCDFQINQNGCTYNKKFNSPKRVKNIYINFEDDFDKNFKLTINTISPDNTNNFIIENTAGVLLENNTTIPINKNITGFNLQFIPISDNNATLNVESISYNNKNGGSWICPILQNIDLYPENNITTTCSSGNVVTLTSENGSQYTICNDGLYGSDNSDGTFSTEEGCNSICKIGVTCRPNTTVMSTTELAHSFREGCIEGQAACNNETEDCKKARITKQVILNETVFDASSKGVKTVENTIAVDGVDRPRVNPIQPTGPSDYEKIQREEWKDEAFKDMVLGSKYAISDIAIGEDSNASSGFRKGITSGTSYGSINANGVYSLSWNLKPRTLDVNNGIQYNLYAVIEVELFYYGYDQDANLIKKGKKIWYIKKNNSDDLEAIKYGDNIGRYEDSEVVDPDTNTSTFTSNFIENTTATIDYEHFNPILEEWVPYDPSSELAKSFKTMSFGIHNLPYWNIPIINNIGNLTNELDGAVRSITDGQTGTVRHYSGAYDGTGDGMLAYTIYVGYSESKLDYEMLFDKIDSGEFPKIYKFKEDKLYRNKPKSNSPSNNLFEIYQYGGADSATIFVTIKPKPEDIGKKGFIYVFFQ